METVLTSTFSMAFHNWVCPVPSVWMTMWGTSWLKYWSNQAELQSNPRLALVSLETGHTWAHITWCVVCITICRITLNVFCSGNFGEVYKGVLDECRQVAIKSVKGVWKQHTPYMLIDLMFHCTLINDSNRYQGSNMFDYNRVTSPAILVCTPQWQLPCIGIAVGTEAGDSQTRIGLPDHTHSWKEIEIIYICIQIMYSVGADTPPTYPKWLPYQVCGTYVSMIFELPSIVCLLWWTMSTI